MTNATDVLLVGGPGSGDMHCLNRNAPSFPSKITMLELGVGEVVYRPVKFWSTTHQRWYWVATSDELYPVDGQFIAMAIELCDFQPAWDLRDLPPPAPEEV